ncbi:MAG TPA: hypothetical protein VIC33_12540 [Vicinamibacterales bacterium]
MRVRETARVLLLLAALPLTVGGCARLHARSQPQMPALATPPPPPHRVEPEPPPLPSTPSEPAVPAPAGPAATKTAPERPEANKPRPPPAPAPEPKPEGEETPKTAPPPTLQTAPSAETGAEARSIRDTLARASKDLSGVDYQHLTTDGRAQYDTAQRFIRQAEAALKGQNYIVARNLADKAAVLAALLRGGV